MYMNMPTFRQTKSIPETVKKKKESQKTTTKTVESKPSL